MHTTFLKIYLRIAKTIFILLRNIFSLLQEKHIWRVSFCCNWEGAMGTEWGWLRIGVGGRHL